jgi:hypothetical protein
MRVTHGGERAKHVTSRTRRATTNNKRIEQQQQQQRQQAHRNNNNNNNNNNNRGASLQQTPTLPLRWLIVEGVVVVFNRF